MTPGTRDAGVLTPDRAPPTAPSTGRDPPGRDAPGGAPGAEIPTGTIVGAYRVLSELGRGGMGVVYRAEDVRRGGVVALKTLLWGDPSATLRFKNEFRAIADVTHENLASLYELVSDGGRLFFTMELVEGVGFLEWVQEDAARLRPALAQLARGLAALHAAGRIHRDVKPSNVLVARDGRVVILDFGLAATLGREGAHQSTQHRAIGTPAYMAPEQALGQPVTSACDWYSVGVMLYEALTGRVPFDGTGVEILVGKQRATPPPPSSVASGVPQELDTLCAALLRRDPDRRPDQEEVLRRLCVEDTDAVPAAAPPIERGRPTIVGREPHMRALRGALDALRERLPVVALVHGNSGMGKSTLLQSFLDEVRGSGDGVVLHGKCYERESMPYKALDGPIDALARHLGRLSREKAESLLPRDVHSIARVFPVLRRVEAIACAPQAVAETSDAQELRRRAFAGLREVFARIADRRPLVLAVDDLQWGDADSAHLLSHLVRPPDAPVFLFVGCYRREDAEASSFLRAFRQAAEGALEPRTIPVDQLSARDSRVLAATLLGRVDDGDGRIDVVARESGGSPFFLHELAAHGGTESGVGDVTLDDVLRRRVAAIPLAAGALLDVIAVAGGPIAATTAAFAAKLPPGAQSSALAALRGARLVRVASAESEDELDTYHDRIREAVLAGLPETRQRELHRRLGNILEAGAETDAELLGLHFERAGDAARAGTHYARAADDAHGGLAFRHAVRLYRKAIDLLDPVGDERTRLLRGLADTLADSGHGAEAAPVYLEAAERARGTAALQLRSRAAVELLKSGQMQEWRVVAEPVLREVGFRPARSTLAWAARIAWAKLWVELGGFRYRARDPESIPVDDILALDTLGELAWVLSLMHPLEGYAYHLVQLRLALRLGDRLNVTRAVMRHLGYDGTISGVPRRVSQLRREATRLAGEIDDPRTAAVLDVVLGAAYLGVGEWETSYDHCRRGAARIRAESLSSCWERDVSEFLGLVDLDFLGRYDELSTGTAELLRDAQDRGSLFLETEIRTRLLPFADLVRDAPGVAREGLDAAIARWKAGPDCTQYFRWIELRLHVALYAGELEDTNELANALWRRFPLTFLGRIPLLMRILGFGRGRLALLAATQTSDRGRRRAFAARARRIGRSTARAENAYAVGWGRLLLAGASRVAGRDDACLEHLSIAQSAFEASSMSAYVAVTQTRRGELIGGDEGRALISDATSWFEREHVVAPDAWTRMLAPGFDD